MQEDILHPNGLFNPALRFAFTNITQEEFKSYWNGSPIIVKPGQTVELQHHLAVKMTKELVDQIMQNEVKIDEIEHKATAYYRSPKGMNLGVPAARKVWEDKIVRVLDTDEESPEIQVMRAQLKQEILAAQNKEQLQPEPVRVPTSFSEFAELKSDKDQTPKVEKKPIRMKEVK
jgi:hypothetical protein